MTLLQFTSVQFHKAYTVVIAGETTFYSPSMTALDKDGQVWGTFQNNNGEWAPWARVGA